MVDRPVWWTFLFQAEGCSSRKKGPMVHTVELVIGHFLSVF